MTAPDRLDHLEELAVSLRGITKIFPQVQANRAVDLLVRRGEIHALIGENGAGKSTLMNILYGLCQADAGEIRVNGREVQIHGPQDAIRLGIGMIHQHFMLIPTLTVAENVVLGMEPHRGVFLDIETAEHEIEELSQTYQLEIDPKARVQDLPVGLQQRVEIIKVLYRGARILILDEPTAVLTPQEVQELFTILRSLRDQGQTIIFITHKLQEVLAVSQRISVMRRGETVAGGVETSGTTQERLAELMVGRPVLLRAEKHASSPGEMVLDVRGVSARSPRCPTAVNKVSFQVHAGEVFGIAGVEGNGQSELVQVLTGLRPATEGQILLEGMDITRATPRQIFEAGLSHIPEDPSKAHAALSHIPEDRHRYGLVLDYSVEENLILGRHYRRPFAGRLRLRFQAIAEYADMCIRDFDVRPPDRRAPVRTLSGGNQQKLIVAREINRNPWLLIAAQLTRGVDIGAIEFIHRRIMEARDTGVAILLVSAELTEVMSLSDRIGVMYGGELVGIVKGGEVTEQELGLMMTGSRRLPETVRV